MLLPDSKEGEYQFIFDDGDGIVTNQSLEVCRRWNSTVGVYNFPNVMHAGLIMVKQAVDLLIAIFTEDEGTLQNWTQPNPTNYTVNSTSIVSPEQYLFSRFFGEQPQGYGEPESPLVLA